MLTVSIILDTKRQKKEDMAIQEKIKAEIKMQEDDRAFLENESTFIKGLANEVKRLSYLMNPIDVQIATSLIQELNQMQPEQYRSMQYEKIKQQLFELGAQYQGMERENAQKQAENANQVNQ